MMEVTHTHTYAHTHIRTYTYTHTQIQTYTHTYTHAHARIHSLTHTYTRTECNFLFLEAGRDAEKGCECAMEWWMALPDAKSVGGECLAPPDESFEGSPYIHTNCFKASCDFQWYQPSCSIRQALGACLIHDAISHQSLTSVPGLVYLKPGKGDDVYD